jgi:hypothetical protein
VAKKIASKEVVEATGEIIDLFIVPVELFIPYRKASTMRMSNIDFKSRFHKPGRLPYE